MSTNPQEQLSNTSESSSEEKIVAESQSAEQGQQGNEQEQGSGGDNGGGSAEPQKTIEELFFEKHGISKEDFEEIRQKRSAEKEELEKPKREEKEWLDVLNLGVSDGLLKKEDILKYEQVQLKPDTDLVFDKFKESYKFSDESLDDEEKEEELREAFKMEYPSEKLIQIEAKNMRSEIEKPFSQAKEKYTATKIVADMKQMHKDVVSEVLSAPVVEKVTVNGEEVEISIEQALTQEEVLQSLTKPEAKPLLNYMFELHKTDKDASKALIKAYAENMAREKSAKEKIVDAVWARAEEHFKSVYSIGATAPFGSSGSGGSAGSPKKDGAAALIESMR